MGFFSFSNEFEVAVNQPKKTVYQEIISYIEGKDWYINSLTQLEKISFQTSMTLTTYPIEFNLILKSVNETSTKLFVYARAGQLDMGRSKRIIDEMLNECFGEQDFNIVDEDTSDAAPSVEETSTSASSGEGKEVKAALPGNVLRVEVSVGDEVAEGDVLLVVEAMKMETEVKSPYSGKVQAIEVAQGDTVKNGQTLVVIG